MSWFTVKDVFIHFFASQLKTI